jgi:hypothetical protein
MADTMAELVNLDFEDITTSGILDDPANYLEFKVNTIQDFKKNIQKSRESLASFIDKELKKKEDALINYVNKILIILPNTGTALVYQIKKKVDPVAATVPQSKIFQSLPPRGDLPAAVSAVHTHSTLENYTPLSYELLQENFKDLFVYFHTNRITPEDSSTLNKDLQYFYIRRSNTKPTWLVLSTIRYDSTNQRFTHTSNYYISITSTSNIQLLEVTVYNYSTNINKRYFDYLNNIKYYGIKFRTRICDFFFIIIIEI